MSRHIHILGICGTFMGGLAVLAQQKGYRVTGSDSNVYPPMSTQLSALGIELMEGYPAEHLEPEPDCVVVGNVMARGRYPVLETLLERDLPYTSGPQWLSENILRGRWVLAVAGTHGKTSTASLLAWILEYAGLQPGFLIGGVPGNFGVSARLGEGPFFVVEADEYDTAFFDKRSKFLHYRPRTLILNNLEMDHADIFDDLEAIKRQFQHLIRIVPPQGRIVVNARDAALNEVLERGCWTPVERFALDREQAYWGVREAETDPASTTTKGSSLIIRCDQEVLNPISFPLIGEHNQLNALAATAAAQHAGVPLSVALEALSRFKGIKRRLELRAEVDGVTLYDDFAHHPTAIATTLAGLRAKIGAARLIAVLEPRSNTMRMGVHQSELAPALTAADQVLLLRPEHLGWPLEQVTDRLEEKGRIFDSIEAVVNCLSDELRSGDHCVMMSNGGFGGIHEKLERALQQRSGLISE